MVQLNTRRPLWKRLGYTQYWTVALETLPVAIATVKHNQSWLGVSFYRILSTRTGIGCRISDVRKHGCLWLSSWTNERLEWKMREQCNILCGRNVTLETQITCQFWRNLWSHFICAVKWMSSTVYGLTRRRCTINTLIKFVYSIIRYFYNIIRTSLCLFTFLTCIY